MNRSTFIKLILFSTFLVSCATSPTEAGKKVKLSKDEPKDCRELGDVSGEDAWAGNIEKARNNLRNKAAEMGANYVVMDTITGGRSIITGRAFSCPDLVSK